MEVYTTVNEVEKSVNNYSKEINFALIAKKDSDVPREEDEISKVFPGIREIIRENEGNIEIVTSTQCTISKRTKTKTEKKLFMVPFEESLEGESGCESLHRKMVKLKEEIASNDVECITVDVDGDLDKEKFKKITEHVFRGEKIKISILTQKQHMMSSNMDRNKLETVFVKKTGGTYADMLKVIKDKVEVNDLAVDIQAIQKTRNGDMVFKVKKGGAIQLKERIEKEAGIAAEARRPRAALKIMHIRDIDEIATKKEVEDAIKKAAGPNCDMSLFELRPGMKGTQTITLKIDRTAARKTGDRVRIGLTNCKVEERIEINKCYKCWETGHTAAKCLGQDRRDRCHRCGQVGHMQATCENTPFCLLCEEEGHSANSTRCSKYRRALDIEKRRIKGQEELKERSNSKY